MAIPEIGLLKLKPTKSIDDADLLSALKEVKAALGDFTGYPFHFLQQVEDPSMIYLFGQWQSLEQHYEDLHGTSVFKERVMFMAQFFDFQWMAHYDFDAAAVALESDHLELRRYAVDGANREAVAAEVERVVGGMAGAVSGWKIDKGRTGEECVVLISWPEPRAEGSWQFPELSAEAEMIDVCNFRLLEI